MNWCEAAGLRQPSQPALVLMAAAASGQQQAPLWETGGGQPAHWPERVTWPSPEPAAAKVPEVSAGLPGLGPGLVFHRVSALLWSRY